MQSIWPASWRRLLLLRLCCFYFFFFFWQIRFSAYLSAYLGKHNTKTKQNANWKLKCKQCRTSRSVLQNTPLAFAAFPALAAFHAHARTFLSAISRYILYGIVYMRLVGLFRSTTVSSGAKTPTNLAETGRLLRRPQRKLSQPVLSLLRPHNFFSYTEKKLKNWLWNSSASHFLYNC